MLRGGEEDGAIRALLSERLADDEPATLSELLDRLPDAAEAAAGACEPAQPLHRHGRASEC